MVAERLAQRFPWACPVIVEASVRVAQSRLAGAPVRHYLPVIVERLAADSLQQLPAAPRERRADPARAGARSPSVRLIRASGEPFHQVVTEALRAEEALRP